jgi:hypothetical protein
MLPRIDQINVNSRFLVQLLKMVVGSPNQGCEKPAGVTGAATRKAARA